MANPHTLTWTNPTTNTDGTAYDGATQNAGYTIQLDGQGQVSVPISWATTFDLASLTAFTALKSGSHTVALSVVTKGGTQSAYSTPATFFLYGTPVAPSAVVVA